ncbi:hypothetical protein TH61_17585 [Rufibacter sp. DG15C]|uniref:PAS domain-containing sensor histidine kinase n=1 Tax=Rufibacter sp. DG15C TaxID=1379909 RepID=UPI00078C1B6C|nr:PAS domain-containing sensor histidine kinase [Rufibacter sp. DG15C]AMM52626.1 hypothetical protein TH61_17585 [Rufibacter sp. DG15C]
MESEVTFQHAPLVERVAETFGQAYFVYDLKSGRFKYLNKAFSHLFGISEEIALADAAQILGYLHEEDRPFLYDQYAKLLEVKEQEGIEFRLQIPAQDEKWICLCCQLYEEKDESLVTGFAEDITQRKEYQANILKFNSKKNSTLEILSHDLAAPFNNIEGMIELLETELKDSESVVLNLVHYIKENAKKGSDMIRDFVDNEFLESSQIVLHKERVDICHRVQIMIDNYKEMSGGLISKNFVMEIPEEPLFMYLDVMKFMQAFNNLISNAIKFTEDHGTIQVKVEDKIATTLFTVSDDGIGIPNDLQARLFDKFTSSRREGVKGEKTVGLGMSIIKKIVELHQGKVWFESQEGRGTTFYMEIPKE